MLSKMKETEKEIHLQLRKKIYKIAITSGKRVVAEPTEKWKNNDTTTKVFENN